MNIGLFDSGLGGLTILRAVAKALPQYDYCYYGDTANLPYGNRSEAEIRALTKAGVEELFRRDCVLVIIACNTASAETLRALQDEWLPVHYPDRRILGVIVPTVEEFNESGKTTAALIATKRTVESKKYETEMRHRCAAGYQLTSIATPELVPFIEIGETEMAATAAISRLEREGGDSEVIILGCTHYTEIKEQLRARFPDTLVLSQDEIIPKKLDSYLAAHPELRERLTSTGKRDVHLTAHRPEYDRVMSQFLGGVYVDEESEDS